MLNAAHVLHGMLAAGRARARTASRATSCAPGVAPGADAERESWARLQPGDEVIAEVGGRPVVARRRRPLLRAQRRRHVASRSTRSWSGEPRTIVPAHRARHRLRPAGARASRAPTIAAGARAAAARRRARRRRGRARRCTLAEPALFPRRLARRCAWPPRRSSAPAAIAPAFVRSRRLDPDRRRLRRQGHHHDRRRGFALPDDDIHAPNESYRLESLRLGRGAPRASSTRRSRAL